VSSLKNKTVLVIGRGSGIARAVALAAAREGAKVIVAGRDVEKLEAAYIGTTITAETIDVTDETSIASLAERLGAVDHVVTTASARARGTVSSLTAPTVLASFATKAVAPIILAKHFAPRMPADGSFVLSSGASALKPSVGMLGVAATNAAVDVVTRGLAIELAPIRVNAVSPGTIDTGAYDGLGDEAKTALYNARIDNNPVHRIGQAEDVAGAVIFAMTNGFVTGVSIPVDGGESLV
jgi:NAD(P)-dependent dehydrogenase (short-subunit alcohol dehydrogenase family)